MDMKIEAGYTSRKMELQLNVPDEVARAAGLTGNEAGRQAYFLMLLELYREGKLSLGRLSGLVELSRAELLDRMADHSTYLNYSSGDLQEDRETLQ
jgi:predicted HTH domain antitoxin